MSSHLGRFVGLAALALACSQGTQVSAGAFPAGSVVRFPLCLAISFDSSQSRPDTVLLDRDTLTLATALLDPVSRKPSDSGWVLAGTISGGESLGRYHLREDTLDVLFAGDDVRRGLTLSDGAGILNGLWWYEVPIVDVGMAGRVTAKRITCRA
jgi:hypothetical protein